MGRIYQQILFLGISIFIFACGHSIPKIEGSYDQFQGQYGYLTLKSNHDSLVYYAKLRLPETSEDDFWKTIHDEKNLDQKWILLLAWQKRFNPSDSLIQSRNDEIISWTDTSTKVRAWLFRKFYGNSTQTNSKIIVPISSQQNLSSSSQFHDSSKVISKIFCKKYFDSLWLSAFELEQRESYDSSLVAYNFYLNQTDTLSLLCQQANFADKDERKGIAWFRKGFTLRKSGLDSLFLQWFDTSTVAKQSLTYKGAARMLLADYYAQQGDSLTKNLFLTKSLQDHPINYYGWLARKQLKTPDPQVSPLGNLWTKNPPCNPSQYDVNQLYKVSLILGLNEIAEGLLNQWVCNSPNSHIPFAHSALHYGNPALAYRLARNIVEQSIPRQKLAQMPDSLLQIYFPQPYREIVLSAAKEFQIDSFFIWSIMRQESTFDPEIQSPVGATGLLQIMPATARTLASELQISEWQDSLLTNPQYNIRLGAYYLSQLQSKYGDSTWAIAHYNAGPKPVARWRELENRKSLAKPYAIEEISYKETRDYVKKVLANWWNYQAFYRKPQTP